MFVARDVGPLAAEVVPPLAAQCRVSTKGW